MDHDSIADLRRQCEELQRQLRCREDQLQQVAQMIHEIGQPLYAIGNYAAACAQALQAESPPRMAELCGWISQIAQQSERAGGITRSLSHVVHKLSPRSP
jgi:two-component system sensor kinase FixL